MTPAAPPPGPAIPPPPGGFNWKILLAGLLLVLPLVAVLASGFGRDPKGVSNALEGKAAGDFALDTLDGERFHLGSQKGPVVLNFWATWCQPCLQEDDHLQRAAATYGPQGVRFLGVLYQDDPAKARPFLKRNGSIFPTLLDPDGRTSIDYGVAGVPETFVIRADGTIARKFTGPVSFGELAAALEPLL